MNIFTVIKGGLAIAGLVFFLVGFNSGNTGLMLASAIIVIGAFLVPKAVKHFASPEVRMGWRVRFAVTKFITKKYGPILAGFLFDKGVQAGSAVKAFLVKHTPGVTSALWKGLRWISKKVFLLADLLFSRFIPWVWKQLPDPAKMVIAGVALFVVALNFQKTLGNWSIPVGFAGMVVFGWPIWKLVDGKINPETAEAKKAKADKKKAELEEQAKKLQAERELILAERGVARAQVDLEIAKVGLQKDERANEFLRNLKDLAQSGLSKENLDSAFRQKFAPKKEKQQGGNKK